MTCRPSLCTATRALMVALALLVALTPLAAAQQDGLTIAIRGSDFEEDGTTSVRVAVGGRGEAEPLTGEAFSVSENGQAVGGIDAEPLAGTQETRAAAMLAIDASSSMTGEPLATTQAAGRQLAETLTEQNVAVGVISYADVPEVVAAPSTDLDGIVDAIDQIETEVGTAFFDTAMAGLDELRASDAVVGSLILLADGEDNASESTLEDVIAQAQDDEVQITVVALETPQFDADALAPLPAETGGTYVTTDDLGQVEGIFADIAGDVISQYELTYTSSLVDTAELDLTVQVTDDDQEATTSFVVPNPRSATAVESRGLTPVAGPTGPAFLQTPEGFWTALGLGFVALAVILLWLFVPRGDRRASRTLQRGITLIERSGGDRAPRPQEGITASEISQRAADAVARIPRREGYDDQLQTEIDRAGWRLRATEFTALRLATGVGGLALFWALSGRWWAGLIGAVIGALGPVVVLRTAKRRRQKRFMEQLPDALQLLSGTLKAGYGVLQALDTIVQEMSGPISQEFQRALTEARLGLPLEESLTDMAERIESDDFRWVVVAMNIQRTVGGNLAELLETVAATLRGRAQVYRQVDVLTAEGKLSAYILYGLPFVIVLYLLVVNPTYLVPLFTTFAGLAMLAIGVVLMIIGAFWMRRVIRIEV